MPWNEGLTKLRDLLAELYPTIDDAEQIVDQAKVPRGKIAFNPASQTNWYNILKEADRHKMVQDVVAVARGEFKAQAEELTQGEQEYLGVSVPAGPGAAPREQVPATGAPVPAPTIPAAVVRDLLLEAFTADDLRRLFVYTQNAALRPVAKEFSSSDGLTAMAEKAITYCGNKGLFPALLEEVKQANPYQYARFEPLLQSQSAGTPPAIGFPASEQRAMLEQELAQHQRNLTRLRAKKAVYAAGEEPLSLLNQIDHEEQEIQRVQAVLSELS